MKQFKSKFEKKSLIASPKRDNPIVIQRNYGYMGNKNGYSELIANIIIQKIINKAVNKAYLTNVEKKLGRFCFKGLKNTFQNLNKINCLEHDNDDCSTWENIYQPVKPSVERGISTCITIIRDSLNSKYTKSNSKFLFARNQQHPLTIKESQKKINVRPPELSLLKKKSPPPIDIFSGDLKDIEKPRKESEEFTKLRKEKAIEILNQEEEKKHKKEKQRKFDEQLAAKAAIKTIQKNLKPFNSDRLTFDPNGKLIPLNVINVDRLSSDFSVVKANIKEPIVFSANINDKNDKKPIKINISSIDDDDSNSKSITNSNKNKDQLPILTLKEVEYNPLPAAPKPFDGKAQIYPSGNNYDIMIPTTGVIIKGDLNKSKNGDMNFQNKFKKYSTKDYQKMVTEYSLSSTQSPIMLKSFNQSIPVQESNYGKSYFDMGNAHNSEKPKKTAKKLQILQMTKSTGMLFNFKKPISPLFSEQNFMKVKNPDRFSLKATLDSIDTEDIYLRNREFIPSKKKLNRLNLFKTGNWALKSQNNLTNSFKEPEGFCSSDLTKINQFNKELMTQESWGKTNLLLQQKPNFFKYKVPSKGNFKLDLDSKISDIKSQRERKNHKFLTLNKTKSLF